MKKMLKITSAFVASAVVCALLGGTFWAWVYAMGFDIMALFKQVTYHPVSLGLGISTLISSLGMIALCLRLDRPGKWILAFLTLVFSAAATLPIYLLMKR